MKMAKVQKATLDPTKISGRCGRLKCCLRYEYDIYDELQRDLPPIGSDIVTTNGRARVLGQEILAQQLLVAMEDNRRVLIPAGDVLSVLTAGSGRRERRGEGERGRGGDGETERRKDRGAERGGPPASPAQVPPEHRPPESGPPPQSEAGSPQQPDS
jgi:hypothetical protein